MILSGPPDNAVILIETIPGRSGFDREYIEEKVLRSEEEIRENIGILADEPIEYQIIFEILSKRRYLTNPIQCFLNLST